MTTEVVEPTSAPAPAPVEAPAPAPVAAAPAAATPTEYADFTVAEGQQLNPDVATEVKALAKDLGLTQEAAQRLYEKGAGMQARNNEALTKALTDAREQWKTEARADAEIGGPKYDENMALVAKARETYGSPALTKLLSDSGLADHPEMVRLFVKVGKTISQDTPFGGGRPAANVDPAANFYASMAKSA